MLQNNLLNSDVACPSGTQPRAFTPNKIRGEIPDSSDA
jgi:hypothetical protein